MIASEIEGPIAARMRDAGIGEPVVRSFLRAVHQVSHGETGLLPERTIAPLETVPLLENVRKGRRGLELLRHLAVIKLNGGLGTSMGLDRAKSLIAVKGADTFLDFIARQILALRGRTGLTEPAFYLMNSFSTRKESLEHLSRYPGLSTGGTLDFCQSKVPKLWAETLEPVSWPEEPHLEWCPPGHGDLYPSLLASGLLDQMLERGIHWLFVSNVDNLGATVDLDVLDYFERSGFSFLMEVARRTQADRKGGHLARRRSDNRLVLRESAQCPAADNSFFQDIDRHRYFNTNNLWIRLDALKAELDRQQGSIALPLIKNIKPVDPRSPGSPNVLQLESAMGAAIECFDRSGGLLVPRARFTPVKTTSDLLALRSDAYQVTEDYRLVLAPSRRERPPIVELDPEHYRVLADFENMFPAGPPSLIRCESIKVWGKVRFAAGVVCEGKVQFANPTQELKVVPEGTYYDSRIEF